MNLRELGRVVYSCFEDLPRLNCTPAVGTGASIISASGTGTSIDSENTRLPRPRPPALPPRTITSGLILILKTAIR